MQLTVKRVAEFIGGEMEIQNQNEGYLYRGPIESATIEDGEIKVRFTWLAKNDGGPHQPTPAWTSDNQLDYTASLTIYDVLSDIGEGRIALQSIVTGETAILFPPGGSKLDPSRVAGLEIAN